MRNLKYFYSSIFLLGLSLLFIPRTCNADMSIGFLLYKPSLLVLILFLGVWIIEAITIRKKLQDPSLRALLASLTVNIATSLLGALFFFLYIFNYIFDAFIKSFWNGAIVLIISIFISVVVEAGILFLFYRQKQWWRIVHISCLMNVKSYLFLIVFMILDILVIFAPFIVVLIIPYCFLKIFEFITVDKKISKPRKKIYKILVIVSSLILCGIIFFGAGKAMNKASEEKRFRYRDVEIKADLSQIRSEIELYYIDKNDLYDEFSTDLVPPKCSDDAYAIQISPNDNKYLAYAKLCHKNAFWCVDSKGNSKEVVADSIPSDIYTCP